MCMLHYFAYRMGNRRGRPACLPYNENCGIHAAYVNHNIRTDSNEDAKLIKRKCEEYGVPFYELFIDKKIYEGKGGFEALAREARYNLLFDLKKKLGVKFLATAHHKNDQAETVFLRISRGTGLKGLRGILAEREDGVIRPMLKFTREDLLKYAEENNIEWREDSTNKNLNYFRNFVRLQILPNMEKTTIDSLANIAALSQRIYPNAIKILNSYFNRFLEAPHLWVKAPLPRTKRAVLLKHFYLLPRYGLLFRLWLDTKGISWEQTNEDEKFYQKLQMNKSFRFRLGKAYFERKREYLWCGM